MDRCFGLCRTVSIGAYEWGKQRQGRKNAIEGTRTVSSELVTVDIQMSSEARCTVERN